MISNLFQLKLLDLRRPDHLEDGRPVWEVTWSAPEEMSEMSNLQGAGVITLVEDQFVFQAVFTPEVFNQRITQWGYLPPFPEVAPSHYSLPLDDEQAEQLLRAVHYTVSFTIG